MADQFVAEIRIMGCNFPPTGWAFCNGQILPISQNTALFSLLGTNYGGNGVSTFALPNLQGCSPMHNGNGPGLTPRVVGESGGSENVTLLSTQMPSHSHGHLAVSTTATTGTPDATVTLAKTASAQVYHPLGANQVTMAGSEVGPAGGNLPHNNRQPYLALNFVIALQGIFPPRP